MGGGYKWREKVKRERKKLRGRGNGVKSREKEWEREGWEERHTKEKSEKQGGITCGANDDACRSSKAIKKRVIINFRYKSAVIACFRTKLFLW